MTHPVEKIGASDVLKVAFHACPTFSAPLSCNSQLSDLSDLTNLRSLHSFQHRAGSLRKTKSAYRQPYPHAPIFKDSAAI